MGGGNRATDCSVDILVDRERERARERERVCVCVRERGIELKTELVGSGWLEVIAN